MRLQPILVLCLGSLLASCSLRDSERLIAGRGGGEGGTAGSGGLGGAGGEGGGGGPTCVDCDRDGECDDLMTSSAHCGVCDAACTPGPCVQGACVITQDMSAGAGMMGVGSNSSLLYYAGTNGGVVNIFTMALGGGSPTSLVALQGSVLSDVFVNASDVYVVFENTAPPAVAKGDKDEILDASALAFFDSQALGRLDGDGVTVCWTMFNGARCTFDGVAQDAIDVGELTADVAVSSNEVYITAASGKVYAAPIDGMTTATEIAEVTEATTLGGIDVDQGQLYIATDDGIWTVPVSGGTPTALTSEPHPGPFDLVVDQGQIYVTTIGDSRVRSRLYRAPIGGGAEELLYDPPPAATAFVPFVEARDDWVYFTSFAEARLYRRHRDAAAPR